MRPRAAADLAAPDVLQGRRAGEEDDRDPAAPRRSRPAWRCAASNVSVHVRHRPRSLGRACRRRAARPGLQQRPDQRAAGDAARRRHRGHAREHRRDREALSSTRCRSSPGRTCGSRSPTRASAFPNENLGSIFDPVLQHQAEGQRPRPRDLVLDRQEPRRVRRRRVDARPRNDACTSTCPRSVAPAAARLRNRSMVTPAGHRGRILVMDDEPSIRMIAANMLQLLGHDAVVDRQRPCRDRAVPSRARTAAAIRRGDARPGHARRHGRQGNDGEPRGPRSGRQRDRRQRLRTGPGTRRSTGTTDSRP